MKEIIISANEREFILNSLKEGETKKALRVDGRGIYDFRTISIIFRENFNQQISTVSATTPLLGHVEVQLGKTRVCAVTSCSIVEPFPDRPTEGMLIFNTELSPMSSAKQASEQLNHARKKKSEFAVELSRVIERGIRGSRAIDTEALCIIAGKKVWSLRVDLHILDNDGNVTDCAHIAAITSLLHFRRPDISIEGEEVIVHSPDDREPIPLSIHHIPICVSFAFFGGEGELVCVDPMLKEELIADGTMTIAMNIHDEICAIQKAGGIPLAVSQILKCTKIATVKAKEITEVLKAALKEEEQRRKTNKTPSYARIQPKIVKEDGEKASTSSKKMEDADDEEIEEMSEEEDDE